MLAFREDLEAIEARLCRVGITSVAELQAVKYFGGFERWNGGDFILLRLFIEMYIYIGCGPLTVTMTTGIITFLIGNPYKPSFTTVTGRGPHSMYTCICIFIDVIWHLSYDIYSCNLGIIIKRFSKWVESWNGSPYWRVAIMSHWATIAALFNYDMTGFATSH